MTILRTSRSHTEHDAGKLSMAQILDAVTTGEVPLRFTAFDGSAAGPEDAPLGLAPQVAARSQLPRDGAGRPRHGPRLRRR